MDPGTIIDLTTMVISICNDYRSMKDDIRTIVRDLDGFLSVLKQLQDVMKTGHIEGPAQSMYDDLIKSGGVLTECNTELLKLKGKLKPMKKLKSFLLTLAWPLVKNDVAEALTSLEKKKATLNTALHVIQISLAQSVQQGVYELAKSANDAKDEELRGKIYQWLTAPDPSVNYEAALRKRTTETGTWLIDDKRYKEWKNGSEPFLWIHGMAGCGKSVLCSTAIEDLQNSQSNQVTLAYYYFDFNDPSKQECNNLLRSLVAQFFRVPAVPGALLALYQRCNNGQQRPFTNDLLEIMHKMLDSYQHAYIILDALDECVEQRELLDILDRIVQMGLGTIHIFATSRMEHILECGLKPLISAQINIQSSIVNMDIQRYIKQRLQNDPKLNIWGQKEKEDIMRVISAGAHGMFQWAVCQLDMLENCYSAYALDKALASLPKTLNETYQRILQKIPEENHMDVFCILQWVAFSRRPITIEEVAEALGIDFNNGDPHFNIKKRWHKLDNILHICVNLVTTDENNMLRLAHFSVKEYLISDYMKTSFVTQYWFSKQSANIFISQCCLAYLLQFDSPDALDERKIKEFPLASYAGKNWMYHAQFDDMGSSTILKNLIIKLFQPTNPQYSHWVAIESVHRHSFLSYKALQIIPNPIYYASQYRLEVILKVFLIKGVDVNAKGGKYGNALQAASFEGHKEIIQLLLDKGADVNAQGGIYETALQAAVWRGHEGIVQLLLAKGADVNIQGGEYENVLCAAVEGENERIIQLLLANGANVNAQGGEYGNALQLASYGGNEKIVQLLLAYGADINIQGGEYGNALQAAIFGSEKIVQLLLDKGADINAQGGEYGNALQAAIYWTGNMVQLLLDKGVNITAQGGKFGNALQVASYKGNEAIVQQLLDKGMDVNIQGGEYGNALQAASYMGHERIIQLLLDQGININAQGGRYGSALQAAIFNSEKTFQLLLAKGADINAQGGEYGNILQAASFKGYKDIVQLLLDKGADVNAQGGEYGNALQAASYQRQEEVVQLLLSHGADINAQGGKYGNALQAAVWGEDERIVQLLLSRGVDVNAQGGEHGNALQAAKSGPDNIVQLLLDKGADANAQGGK